MVEGAAGRSAGSAGKISWLTTGISLQGKREEGKGKTRGHRGKETSSPKTGSSGGLKAGRRGEHKSALC